MATHKSAPRERLKAAQSRGVIRRALAGVGAGTPGVAGVIYLLIVQHVPFTAQAGIFEDLVAVVVLIALIAVALIAVTVSLDHLARSRLRYRAGVKAVDTAESNDQALETYRTLHSSLSFRWLRSFLSLTDEPGDSSEGDPGKGGGSEARER